ncbi:MAG: Hpt domain-containing protein [Bacteriovorax sp.]
MQIPIEHKLKYLHRRVGEIAELNDCLVSGNFEAAMMIGHRLKGNGETFGFPSISSIGMSLEQAAQERDKEKLKEFIEKLSANVNEKLKQIANNECF